MKTKFKNSTESLRWLALRNENNCCYEAAERLYRQAGREEDADRCLRMRMKHRAGAADNDTKPKSPNKTKKAAALSESELIRANQEALERARRRKHHHRRERGTLKTR